MTYFKVIRNDIVVDVGTVFLKWNINKHKFNICSTDEGQFVQSYKEDHIYRDSWMKQHPDEAKGYDNAKVVIIAESEYNDLRDLLGEGETVEVDEIIIPSEEVHEVPVQELPEKKLSLAELRELVVEQQKQIELLNEKLNS